MKRQDFIIVQILVLEVIFLLIGGFATKIFLGVSEGVREYSRHATLDALISAQDAFTSIMVYLGVILFHLSIIGIPTIFIWRYQTGSSKYTIDEILDREYANLINTDALREKEWGYFGERIFTGHQGKTPVVITLTRRHTDSLITHQRTTFFSPLSKIPFRVLPTGKVSKNAEDIPSAFADAFYIPTHFEGKAFSNSGFDVGIMSVVLDFIERRGGFFSIGEDGISWVSDRLFFHGQGTHILAEFEKIVRLITNVFSHTRTTFNIPGEPVSTLPLRVGPPLYLLQRTLVFLFPSFLILGGVSCLLFLPHYSEYVFTPFLDAQFSTTIFARFLLIVNASLLILGYIGTPLTIIHRIRRRPASF